MVLTYFYAQWFGLFIAIIALGMLANRHAMMETIRELLANRAIVFVVALVTLLIGLLVVLTHDLWTGGAVSIIITLLGWLLILRSVLLLFLPQSVLRKIVGWVRLEQTYYLIAVIALLLGAYLAWNGFNPPAF